MLYSDKKEVNRGGIAGNFGPDKVEGGQIGHDATPKFNTEEAIKKALGDFTKITQRQLDEAMATAISFCAAKIFQAAQQEQDVYTVVALAEIGVKFLSMAEKLVE